MNRFFFFVRLQWGRGGNYIPYFFSDGTNPNFFLPWPYEVGRRGLNDLRMGRNPCVASVNGLFYFYWTHCNLETCLELT